ncbi:MAG: twitching motility protein PilT [Synergistaceae bacterium]|jgi:uncharacterized protein YacL|nr:twitching motility protein PilT [Synergistaceae bacterium]
MPETGIIGLMKFLLRCLLTIVSGIAGYQIAQLLMGMDISWMKEISYPHVWSSFCVLLFALCGYMLTPLIWWILKKVGLFFENMLQNVSVQDITVSVIGLIVSLLLANLIAILFIGVPASIGFYIRIGLNILFAYIGTRAFMKRRDDVWAFVLSFFGFKGRLGKRDKDAAQRETELFGVDSSASEPRASRKVIDTSALIDGRILDVAGTGFLEGTLLLPRFVLTELQGVADSSDPVRRTRGRKGLNVVSELQKISGMDVKIQDVSLRELKRDKVDEALVELCKKTDAKIMTTDYNLNQIARIEGVDVLNVNDLANSLKPQFLPGEQVKIDIIRPGKEQCQGIGYLEDGTMLVVEDGESAIGQTAEIVITSMLQTSAGRMVFGKLKR